MPARRKALLALFLLQACACVHVRPSEVHKVRPESSPVNTESLGALKVESLVYHRSALPLETFFKRLAAGELSEAFRKLKLAYTPTNADSEALERLLDNGYVPVLVNVSGTGTGIQDPSSLSFRLAGSEPIAPGDLPAVFRHLSWPAVAANAYNVSVVVIGCTAVIAAELAFNYATRGGTLRVGELVLQAVREKDVLNPVTRSDWMDYEEYLYKPRPLSPGERIGGLMFFKLQGPEASDPGLRLSVSSL